MTYNKETTRRRLRPYRGVEIILIRLYSNNVFVSPCIRDIPCISDLRDNTYGRSRPLRRVRFRSMTYRRTSCETRDVAAGGSTTFHPRALSAGVKFDVDDTLDYYYYSLLLQTLLMFHKNYHLCTLL